MTSAPCQRCYPASYSGGQSPPHGKCWRQGRKGYRISTMNSASTKRLAKVHPLLAEKVQALAKALASKRVNIEVVQGLRTWAEQDELYAQGRTKAGKRVTNAHGGQSNHNYGLAVDVCPFKDGKAQWEDDAGFAAIGAEARKLGLDWGGDWKRLKDMPHVQLRGMSIDECSKLHKHGGLDAVWKRAAEVNERSAVEIEPSTEAPTESDVATAPLDTPKSSDVPVHVSASGQVTQQATVMVPPVATVDTGSKKSLWTTIIALPSLVLMWLSQNIGEALGWLKDRELLRWIVIGAVVIVSIYLLRQIIMSLVNKIGAIIFTLKSMQYHADPGSQNVSVGQPAPPEETPSA